MPKIGIGVEKAGFAKIGATMVVIAVDTPKLIYSVGEIGLGEGAAIAYARIVSSKPFEIQDFPLLKGLRTVISISDVLVSTRARFEIQVWKRDQTEVIYETKKTFHAIGMMPSDLQVDAKAVERDLKLPVMGRMKTWGETWKDIMMGNPLA